MMEKDKLRKADIFSGSLILLCGLFIIVQGLQMPMKDSYGGVQNVWYVSPALFPLFVGCMLSLLGLLLMRVALKAVGREGFLSVVRYLKSSDFTAFLRREETLRFYGIVSNLLFFVFLLVPRVDFFLAAMLFLLVFFFMFYCGDHACMLRIFGFFLCGAALFCCFLVIAALTGLQEALPYSADICAVLFIIGLVVYAATPLRGFRERMRKYRLSLLIAFLAPFTIGIIFKYFLLVPMPHEGLVVLLLDAIWYAEFWS